MNSRGYVSYLNDTQLLWTILKQTDSTKMPRPDSDSPFTMYSISTARCALYHDCETFINVPRFNIYQLKKGAGDDRLEDATFNRFDTCFTYTKDNNIEKFGLYLTQEYTQGLDPFLGGLCPKGHFCTEYGGIGYKEACPAGYYQPQQGVSRSVVSSQCNILVLQENGCQENVATVANNDYTDKVCIRCPRNFFAAKGSAICTECPHGTIKKISGVFATNTPMLNMPTFFISGYNPWYYIQNEQGYQSADCALLPAGIIHIPEANNYMTYNRPDFLAVMACPFGLSSRPGTFAIEKNKNLLDLLLSREDSVIQAPYIRFVQTYTIEEVSSSTCSCSGYSSISKRDCRLYLEEKGIETMLDRAGPKGCFTHAARPDIGFFSEGPTEISSGALTYICRSGIDNDELAGEFSRANCFRCPGNSITGPSSTTCTTCFANQLKVYAKEAIQKFAENTLPSLKLSTSQSDDQMEFSAKLPNYNLIYEADKDYETTEVFKPRRPTDTSELTLADCYLACSSLEDYSLIAIGIKEDYSKCACSSKISTTSSGYKWRSIKGNIGKEGCAEAALDQFGEYAVRIDWYYNGILTDCSQFINDLGPYKGNNTGGWLVGPCEMGRTTNQDCATASALSFGKEACRWGRKLRDIDTGVIVVSRSEVPIGCSVETNVNKYFVNIPHWNTNSAGATKDSGNFKVVNPYPSWGAEALPLCSACQPGKRTDNGCQICSPGFYTETAKEADKSACQNCASGRFSDKSGATGCTLCPFGFYQPESKQNKCEMCPTGWKQGVEGLVTCDSCDSGYYADQGGSSICKICPVGYKSENSGSATCTACEPATYAKDKGSSACKSCEAGRYGTEPAKEDCEPCPIGWRQTSENQQNCERCAIGKFSSATGRDIVCGDCPNGFYQSKLGQGRCVDCPGGKVCQSHEEGATCQSGFYKPPQTHGSCGTCKEDEQVTNNQHACESCSNSKSTAGKTATTCIDCPPEGWSPDEKGTTAMTTFYLTIGVNRDVPYHSCIFGGDPPLCNGFGGQRSVKTYVTAIGDADFIFTMSGTFNIGFMTFKHLEDNRVESVQGPDKKEISLKKGDRLEITMEYSRFNFLDFFFSWAHAYHPFQFVAAFTMEPSSLVRTHRTDPGSSYCGLNN